MYVDNNQRGIVNNAINKLTNDANTFTFKDIEITPREVIVTTSGDLRLIQGSLTFENDGDASQVYAELISLVDAPQVKNKIEYVEILLLSNTHHFPNPLPDVVFRTYEGGAITNLDAYELHI